MKNRITILLVFVFGVYHFSFSQELDCSDGRYLDSLFDVTVTQNVLYGNNVNYAGVSTDLYMDIYEPVGDVMEARPLIIFAPKGSFLAQDKRELTMVELCTRFAKKGYVTASIDYRVGVNTTAVITNAEVEFTKAVLRAAHDYKAAIRFFRKDFQTDNNYRIDTNLIIAGGSSAGAITALHVAYLDKESEIPATFDTTGLGGQEGYSGNPGYSSRPHCVVNLCGAIADTNWIEPNDMPLVSMHGNLDTEVPYGTAVISMYIPIMEVSGSASIFLRTENLGIEHQFHTFWGRQHIPYDENAGGSYMAYMDTVETFVTNFLHPQVCGTTGINNEQRNNKSVHIYPNPTTDFLYITDKDLVNCSIEISDVLGRVVYNKTATSNTLSVDLKSWDNGVYVVSVNDGVNKQIKKIIKK